MFQKSIEKLSLLAHDLPSILKKTEVSSGILSEKLAGHADLSNNLRCNLVKREFNFPSSIALCRKDLFLQAKPEMRSEVEVFLDEIQGL